MKMEDDLTDDVKRTPLDLEKIFASLALDLRPRQLNPDGTLKRGRPRLLDGLTRQQRYRLRKRAEREA